MRNLFLVVLAINIVIFMVFYYDSVNNEKVVSLLPANVTKLVLLSEVDKATLTNEDQIPEVVVEVKAKQEKQLVVKKCFTLGPFREESKITEFKKQIKGKVKNIGIRERIEKQHWRYWVYLPNAGSKSKAVKQASNLALKGLKDYYVIARGEHKNSISLGHFKDKLLAEKRLKAIQRMSYKPKMKAIEKEYTLYWLDYVAKSVNGLNSKTLNEFDLEESIHQFKRECAK